MSFPSSYKSTDGTVGPAAQWQATAAVEQGAPGLSITEQLVENDREGSYYKESMGSVTVDGKTYKLIDRHLNIDGLHGGAQDLPGSFLGLVRDPGTGVDVRVAVQEPSDATNVSTLPNDATQLFENTLPYVLNLQNS